MKELESFNRVVDSFRKLPSVGQKSAERMAYAILEMKEEDVMEFIDSMQNLKKEFIPALFVAFILKMTFVRFVKILLETIIL